MTENQERCLKCGKQEGLQGVAVTIGRRTFHLFYLCAKCGDVGIEELLKIIKGYKEKRKPDSSPNLSKYSCSEPEDESVSECFFLIDKFNTV